MAGDTDVVRQTVFFRDVMDPFVRAIITTDDPWHAYDEVARMRGSMLDYVEWGPHGGQVFVAWADLEDLYDTGKTPIEDAHAALRRAAREWLARPVDGPEETTYIEEWTARVGQTVSAITERDGGFWSSPS